MLVGRVPILQSLENVLPGHIAKVTMLFAKRDTVLKEPYRLVSASERVAFPHIQTATLMPHLNCTIQLTPTITTACDFSCVSGRERLLRAQKQPTVAHMRKLINDQHQRRERILQPSQRRDLGNESVWDDVGDAAITGRLEPNTDINPPLRQGICAVVDAGVVDDIVDHDSPRVHIDPEDNVGDGDVHQGVQEHWPKQDIHKAMGTSYS